MKINFKDLTKKYWDALNSKTWNKVLIYYISYNIWMGKSDNQSEILMELIFTSMHDIYLEDWNIDCINKVIQTYGKVIKVVALWLQRL